MTTPPSPSALRPPRDVWLALAVCAVVALLALAVMRVVPDPWTGRTGAVVFGKGGAEPLGTWDRYTTVLRFCLDRESPGRDRCRLDDWVHLGLFAGSALALAAALLAAVAAPWWVRWGRGGARAEPSSRPPPARRWEWAVLGLALALAALIRLPLLSGTILWDEQDNARRNFHGYLQYPGPTEAPVWRGAGWHEALWENERGNNPYLFSLLSQASQCAWRLATGAPPERYSIVAMRLPSAVSGLLAVVALWWSMRRTGLGGAAPWAALLLAAHPLASQYSVEARGYGLSLFLAALLPGLMGGVTAGGRVRDHAAFAAALFLAILAYPGMLYPAAGCGLAVAGVLAWRWLRGKDAAGRAGLVRLAVAGAAAVLALVWLLTPALFQHAEFLHDRFPKTELDTDWYAKAYCYYANGMLTLLAEPWPTDGSGPGGAIAWLAGDFWNFPMLATWTLVAFPLLVAGGLACLLGRQGRAAGWAWLALLASGPLMLIHQSLLNGMFLYYWYVIFILPALAACLGCAIEALGRGLAAWRPPRTGPVAAAVLAAACATALVALSNPAFFPSGRHTPWCQINSRPATGRWSAGEGEIGRTEFARGNSLWVNYEDGFQTCLRDHERDPRAWDAVRVRHLADWGHVPGPVPAGR